ncbi:non-homologous end-joining DNA ligase [Actinoplanes philippinensis]|uniref:non-homologous end-joining DNA ligase n=1 Tax=Actinoplanes philippinensis TaxID=35752 RepID=UPI0033E4F5FF
MNAEQPMPGLVAPMLAAAGPMPADGGWAFEFKYDGVRAVAYLDDDRVRLLSRNDRDVTATYPELRELAGLLPGRRAILDGEIVALEPGDRPSFARLSARIHVAAPTPALLGSVPVVYYPFDLLWLDGRSLLDEPYQRRGEHLRGLGLDGGSVRTPPVFTDADGHAVLRAAELGGLEGVVAKRLSAPYRPGRRSPDWTKVPLIRTQEVLVIGWKPGAGRRAGTVGSLLLAVHDGGALRFAGHVGTGFTDLMLRQLQERFGLLQRTTAPVPDVPREHARHARWLEPALVGEVAFRNWTPDGRLRHPSWRGLRADRDVGAARRHPEPAVPPASGRVQGAFETPDGRWRVEAVQRGRDHFYRLLHGDNVIDGLAIATVQRLLAEAGVDIADLVEPRAA